MSLSMYFSQTTMVKAALVPWGIKVATSTAQEGGKNQKVSEKTEHPKELPQNQTIKYCAIYSGAIKAFEQNYVTWSQCVKAAYVASQ